MAEIITGVITAVVQGAKEILAIVSNAAAFYSAFMAVMSLLQLISAQGLVNGTWSWIIIYLATSAITGLIAEALKSAIPSPFRWIAWIVELIMKFV